MSEGQNNPASGIIGFSSSLKDEIRQNAASESWHFDALSDEGSGALVITFYENYPYSSRYFRHGRRENGGAGETATRFPAVSFTYSVAGKIVFRAVNEFRSDEFVANRDRIECSIGGSSFRLERARYGTGFMVQVDLLTPRKCRLSAELEWLSVEADLKEADENRPSSTSWNLVAPRSDVSGRITLSARDGKTRKIVHFRGTGYHDHFRGEYKTLVSRCWGRAHFIDSTAVFEHLRGEGDTGMSSKLMLISDGSIHQRETQCEIQSVARDRYGLKVPRRLNFISDDNVRLRVKTLKVIQSDFFEVKMVSEITLMLGDGKPRKTLGITEFSAPRRMRNPLLRLVSDLRIGRNGRSAMF